MIRTINKRWNFLLINGLHILVLKISLKTNRPQWKIVFDCIKITFCLYCALWLMPSLRRDRLFTAMSLAFFRFLNRIKDLCYKTFWNQSYRLWMPGKCWFIFEIEYLIIVLLNRFTLSGLLIYWNSGFVHNDLICWSAKHQSDDYFLIWINYAQWSGKLISD